MTSLCSVILIVFAVGDHTAAAFGVMRHKLLYPNIRGRGGNEVIGGIGNDYYAGSQQLHLHHVSKDHQREGSRKRRINITNQSMIQTNHSIPIFIHLKIQFIPCFLRIH